MVICGVDRRDIMKGFQVGFGGELFGKGIFIVRFEQQHFSDKQDVGTHNDDGAGDGDGSHGSMGDGVSPVGIADTLIIAVDSSLVRSEHQRQDG